MINIKSNFQHFLCMYVWLYVLCWWKPTESWRVQLYRHIHDTLLKKNHKIPKRKEEKSPEKKINNFYVKSTHVRRGRPLCVRRREMLFLPFSNHRTNLGWKAQRKMFLFFNYYLCSRDRLLGRSKNDFHLCKLIKFITQKMNAGEKFIPISRASFGLISPNNEINFTLNEEGKEGKMNFISICKTLVVSNTNPEFVVAVKMFMQKITDLSQFLIAGARSHSIPHPSAIADGDRGRMVFLLFSFIFYRR